jgi:hypothetical protein
VVLNAAAVRLNLGLWYTSHISDLTSPAVSHLFNTTALFHPVVAPQAA